MKLGVLLKTCDKTVKQTCKTYKKISLKFFFLFLNVFHILKQKHKKFQTFFMIFLCFDQVDFFVKTRLCPLLYVSTESTSFFNFEFD